MALLDLSSALDDNDVNKVKEVIALLNAFDFSKDEETYSILRNYR
jgi:hypothetical protein